MDEKLVDHNERFIDDKPVDPGAIFTARRCVGPVRSTVAGFTISRYPDRPDLTGMLVLYLALKARAGDPEARQVIEGYNVKVVDSDQKPVWPPNPEEQS